MRSESGNWSWTRLAVHANAPWKLEALATMPDAVIAAEPEHIAEVINSMWLDAYRQAEVHVMGLLHTPTFGGDTAALDAHIERTKLAALLCQLAPEDALRLAALQLIRSAPTMDAQQVLDVVTVAIGADRNEVNLLWADWDPGW